MPTAPVQRPRPNEGQGLPERDLVAAPAPDLWHGPSQIRALSSASRCRLVSRDISRETEPGSPTAWVAPEGVCSSRGHTRDLSGVEAYLPLSCLQGSSSGPLIIVVFAPVG